MSAHDLIALIQRAQAELACACREAQTQLSEGELSLKDQVEIGQILWQTINRAQETLGPIKDSLRDEALHRQRGRPGRQFLAGRSRRSRCTVVVPHPEVRLRAETDIESLRKLLGADFDSFFTTTVTPRRDFSDRAAEHPDYIRPLAHAVDTVSSTPRVTFND